MENCTVIDVFCGIGGLTHGLVLENFRVVAGIDTDSSCRYAFETNNQGAIFINQSVEAPGIIEKLSALYPQEHVKVLVGCAPCQPFSSNNTKKLIDDKWKLLHAFANMIETINPDIVSMENVTRLRSFNNGIIFKKFVQRLQSAGYTISWYEVYCPDYGIPQQRTRLVLFASKFGKIELIKPTHQPKQYKTVRNAISKLEPLAPGQSSQKDRLHWSSSLSPLNLQRIQASTPGGTWHDWDKKLIALCHRKKSGQTFPSVYGRMVWDEPSPTITTQFYGFGNGRFGHPEQDRAISLREGAILQTFPKQYRFVEPGKRYTFENLGRHIGNAVPVALGRVIGRSIKHHLETHELTSKTIASI